MDPIPCETDAIAREIVDAAFKVHKTLGPGLLESVYEICLVYELKKRNLPVKQQLTIPIIYDTLQINSGLRLDLLVNDAVVVELKAVEQLLPIHKSQALTYLKLTGFRLALLINFNVPLIKDGIVRLVL